MESIAKMSAVPPRYACTTLVTTPEYVIGALVLGHSIRQSGWPHQIVSFVTPDISAADQDRLRLIWDEVTEVQPIDNPNRSQEWGLDSFETVYTKLRLWQRTEYQKLVYIDADAVVLSNLDELLDRPRFAAAPCTTAPDQFNSGVMVLEPSRATFDDMMARRAELHSYDGSDQGFLNSYFSEWFEGPPEHRLPLIYNVPRILAYYRPAWMRLEGKIKVLHYYGPRKPWNNKIGWRSKALRWLITRTTSMVIAEPTPATIWWNLHREVENILRTK